MKKRNVTKRIAVIAMATVMALGLVACGKSKTSTEDVDSGSVTSTSESQKETASTPTENAEKQESSSEYDWPHMEAGTIGNYVVETYNKCEDLSDWGNYQCITTDCGNAYIKFPSLIPTGHNYVAYQSDDTVVIFMFASETSFDNEITDAESILSAAIKHPEDGHSPVRWMNSYWKLYGDNKVNMTIDSADTEIVGQFECGHYTGTASYIDDKNGEEKSFPFVGYATFTKGGNEPVYWIVFDESEDKSLGATIADYAKKMGYTLVDDPNKVK
ncbi:MAG: hypothetical protein K5679_01020 [Lachnospiraceae bacterium]|nr:hypothetical protein [Lachnospiraceae bacterium]